MIDTCYVGDVRDGLRAFIAAGHRARTCVTSPPYFGLRDYGMPGQIGMETTPDEYVATLVDVFRLVRDALTDDATCWLNLGDSYSGSGKGGNPPDSQWKGFVGNSAREAAATKFAGEDRLYGYKPKNLLGMPWRVAFALQADGWYLRSDIIWSKPNPMPESVTDRPTKAHEYLFLLAKSERYYFDAEAIKEPSVTLDPRKPYAPGQVDARGNGHDRGGGKVRSPAGWKTGPGSHGDGREQEVTCNTIDATSRNRRTVWTIATEPYPDSHFATFPTALVEPCVLAGSAGGDIVLDPFMGSGTTAQVAQSLGRGWYGCELNPSYVDMQKRRAAQLGLELVA